MPTQQFMAYLTGFAGLALLWLLILIATKKHPWALVIGKDERPSTSKFQLVVWTSAVVFAFLAICYIRFSNGYFQDLPGLPTNLLIAMGISVATTVSAKSIAVKSQEQKNAVALAANLAAPSIVNPNSKSGIFSDDSGLPDIGKVQVMLWTLIAVGVFLCKVFALIQCPQCPNCDPKYVYSVCNLGLPDISQTLMILMGLGHGTYIGKKIVES